MAKPRSMRLTLLRGALLGATALALVNSPLVVRDAAAKVGVTSATDGDPLGKPPQEAERILRIGIDVQANELITTSANDRAHLVFLDGSSLTVGPNAQLTIDKFVFDPNTKTGELAISASKGVLRLVGGKISKNAPITITTPSSTIGIRGGISIHDVSQQRTESMFVFGKDMTVKGVGQPQVATRAGSMITTFLGKASGMPVLVPQGAMNGPLAQLEGRPAPSGSKSGGGGSGNNADQSLKSSGFSAVNSDQPPRTAGSADDFRSGNRNPNDTIITVLSNANQGVQTMTAVQLVQDTRQQQLPLPQFQPQQAAAPSPNLPPPPTTLPTGGPQSRPGNPQPPIPNLPQAATATYAGQMTGLVNGHMVGTGSYTNTWNFTQRTGAITANFQGANFQGAAVGGRGAIFSTPQAIQSSNAPRKLEMIGTFVGPGSQPNYQAGVFNITGNTPGQYNASGAFVGEKRR